MAGVESCDRPESTLDTLDWLGARHAAENTNNGKQRCHGFQDHSRTKTQASLGSPNGPAARDLFGTNLVPFSRRVQGSPWGVPPGALSHIVR